MIPVTKPHLPEIGRYIRYIERCYENNQLTNNGPLAQELKARLEEYLGAEPPPGRQRHPGAPDRL